MRTQQDAAFAPASWFLAGIALVLIAVLTYYLTLTTRPEISEISPSPNTSQIPGVVDLEAWVSSPRSIEDAFFIIDGEEVSPQLEQEGDNRWRVYHEQVFDRGEREIVLKVTDSSGRSAEHSWSFNAGGDLIAPRLVLTAPSSDSQVAPGPNGVSIQSTTFAEIDEIDITFNGESVESDVEEIETGTEYSNDDDMPIYDWQIRATDTLTAGSTIVEAQITDIFGATSAEQWTIRVASDESSADARFFDQTGEYVVEPFLTFWDENEGRSTIGPPVSAPIAGGGGELLQFFRYARLELDTEGVVHRGLIGREMFGEPESPPDRSPGSGARQFDATGHYIIGTIREFWENNGELSAFGYPVSQEFETETGYAQYFERALIEVIVLGSYEIVELAPLGEKLYETHLTESSLPEPDDD